MQPEEQLSASNKYSADGRRERHPDFGILRLFCVPKEFLFLIWMLTSRRRFGMMGMTPKISIFDLPSPSECSSDAGMTEVDDFNNATGAAAHRWTIEESHSHLCWFMEVLPNLYKPHKVSANAGPVEVIP